MNMIDRYCLNYINNHFEHQRFKCTSQKTEFIRVDQKTQSTICCVQETHFKY